MVRASQKGKRSLPITSTPIPRRGKPADEENPKTPGDGLSPVRAETSAVAEKEQSIVSSALSKRAAAKKSKLNYTKGKHVKKHRYRPGTKALKEIRMLQRSTNLL